MRDENRIDYILKMLGKVWHHHPDQRFGQLVVNLCRASDNNSQIFFVEDDDFMRLLQQMTRHE